MPMHTTSTSTGNARTNGGNTRPTRYNVVAAVLRRHTSTAVLQAKSPTGAKGPQGALLAKCVAAGKAYGYTPGGMARALRRSRTWVGFGKYYAGRL